eukprot:g83446.t1
MTCVIALQAPPSYDCLDWKRITGLKMAKVAGPDLTKYMDKQLILKLNGNRTVGVEIVSAKERNSLGTTILRGNSIIMLESLEPVDRPTCSGSRALGSLLAFFQGRQHQSSNFQLNLSSQFKMLVYVILRQTQYACPTPETQKLAKEGTEADPKNGPNGTKKALKNKTPETTICISNRNKLTHFTLEKHDIP